MHQEILDKLIEYKNRQVVMNHYDEEDSLYRREGFFFDTIQVDTGRLIFKKDGEMKYSLLLSEYPSSKVMSDFSDYYSFSNDCLKVNIYFPH